MKIARVEVFGVAMPLVGEYKNAYTSKTALKSTVVRITADDGTVGLGNIDPTPGYSHEDPLEHYRLLKTKLGPLVTGMDPTNIHALMAAMDGAVKDFLDSKAAIEMACVDLTARQAGVPVYTYLGGAVKTELLVNAWIGILSPDAAAAETADWQKKGFRSAKVKVGGDIHADRDRIKAVREAVGPAFKIRIDANCGYEPDESIALAKLLEPFDLQLFEQPAKADDIAGMARVRKSTSIPIMADESVLDHASLIRIIKMEAADIVKVKVMKQGGFLGTRRMIATCEAAGIRNVVGHGFGLGINTMAEMMLAATASNVLDGLECVGPLKTRDDVVTHKLDLTAGRLPLPAGPGLGVTLDDALASDIVDAVVRCANWHRTPTVSITNAAPPSFLRKLRQAVKQQNSSPA